MSKIIKKILNLQKEKNGNISILVLVMSLAIILLTTAMVGYIFHDIGFTEIDKGELRALHFAESGLSNMYLNIDRYNQGLIEDLPDSPYTVDVGDPDDPEGSFTVEYETYYLGESSVIERYDITSTGTDISSGVTRKVKVNTLSFDIFDFIYSGELMGTGQIAGQTNITGPFFVDYIDDKLLGNASFEKGPLFVKGDINMSGSSSIGESTNPVTLFLGGNFYFKDEIIDPLNPPHNSNVYVSEYYHKAFDITFPPIDESYINSVVDSGAQIVPGDLFIGEDKKGNKIIKVGEEEVEKVGGYDNYLEFNEGVLNIRGNIVVYGDIEIGDDKYTIEYSGNANLISTGNITINAKVRPENMNNFPSIDLMALISQYDIDLYAKNGNYEEPDAAVMLIANNKVETQSTNIFLRGGTVSNNLTLKENTTIYYEAGIGEFLTAGVPGFGETMIATINWQEIIAD